MGRTIGAVLLGYVTIAFTVFAGLSLAYVAVGTDGAFRPGLYEVSTLWVAISFVVSFGAALAGGWVARGIGHSTSGPLVLAGVVAVLGVGMALLTLSADADPGLRTGAVGTFEAMSSAQTPFWIMLLNPLVGAVGVLLGGGVWGAASTNVQPDAAAGANAH